jgi:hypothetical protein
MAWIEQRRRADGGLTARVFWRPGGCRDTPCEWETFGAGSDAQNLARADGFRRMMEAAGQRWPDGWVKGEGFVRPPDVADPMTPPPSFDNSYSLRYSLWRDLHPVRVLAGNRWSFDPRHKAVDGAGLRDHSAARRPHHPAGGREHRGSGLWATAGRHRRADHHPARRLPRAELSRERCRSRAVYGVARRSRRFDPDRSRPLSATARPACLHRVVSSTQWS